MGIPYNLHEVNVLTGDQRKPEFLKFNPTGKVPCLVDTKRKTVVFESEAIVKYLALFYTDQCQELCKKWYPTGGRSEAEKMKAVRM